jgi:hypothetical protein
MSAAGPGPGRGPLGEGWPSGERGAVGGVEVLPFGFLVFVVGALLLANAWAVVDAKLAVESAAREAGRAYVEAPDGEHAGNLAVAAARSSIAAVGRDPDRMVVVTDDPPFERCAVVRVEAAYRVPALRLPFVGGFGSGITVHGRHREVVDPFRAGLGPRSRCAP